MTRRPPGPEARRPPHLANGITPPPELAAEQVELAVQLLAGVVREVGDEEVRRLEEELAGARTPEQRAGLEAVLAETREAAEKAPAEAHEFVREVDLKALPPGAPRAFWRAACEALERGTPLTVDALAERAREWTDPEDADALGRYAARVRESLYGATLRTARRAWELLRDIDRGFGRFGRHLEEAAAELEALREGGDHHESLGLVLDEVHDRALAPYVAWPSPEALDAATLYVAATHAQPAWQHAPRLFLTSPLKRCGKTRAQEIMRELVYKPLVAGNISTAALVRSIDESDPPTLILDEADVIFSKRNGANGEGAEDLRGILNNGFSRGWPYRRWDPKARKPEECPTFAMAILAAIGRLPDTIEDRAIIIAMRRRAPGEQVAPFRARRALPRLHELRDRIHRAVRAHLRELEAAEPELPVEDRAADCWEPLIAIADAAGGSWPERARRACLALEEARGAVEDATAAERLLADLREVFGEEEALPTKEILSRLKGIEEAPWAEWNSGRGLTARDLARLLRPYGVRSCNLKIAGSVAKGYRRADLEDPWRRYVGTPAATAATPLPAPQNQALTSADRGSGRVADEAPRSATAFYGPDLGKHPSGSGVAEVADGVPACDIRVVAAEDELPPAPPAPAQGPPAAAPDGGGEGCPSCGARSAAPGYWGHAMGCPRFSGRGAGGDTQ